MMMRLSADDVEPQSLPAGIVLREVRWRCPLPTLVNKDGKLELHSLRRLQPVQLSEEWSDMGWVLVSVLLTPVRGNFVLCDFVSRGSV